ncbi:MAG: hypothetical protein JO264_04570 [Acidisphaera sp.]|nr:hypothetical protein [Acidisphaera sp.]
MAGEEADTRKQRLEAELDLGIKKARARAMTEFWLGQILMLATLVASAVPALAGLFEWLMPKQLGALALAPAALAFVATIFKFPAKANWYWREASSLEAIRNDLLFTREPDVGRLASRRTKTQAEMRVEWEREFTVSWAQFEKSRSN